MDLRSRMSQYLIQALDELLSTQACIRVAVIGGSQDEPELLALSGKYNVDAHFFGIETLEASSFSYLDLNSESPADIKHLGQYDLILCSQVLEHLWNVPQAFVHFNALLKSQGLAWIACPYSNFFHGSPHFYSAGYTPDLIIKLAELRNLRVIRFGFLGSKRLYRSRHLLSYWLSDNQLRNPLFSYFGVSGNYFKKFLFNLRILPERLILFISSNAQSESEFNAVETWALIKKV